MKLEGVRMLNAALDEDEHRNIVLRGVIAPESLSMLKAGPYQREILPVTTIKDLAEAFNGGCALPDVYLGMRGGNYTEHDGSTWLEDAVYIIDGLQRVTAAQEVHRTGKVPRLGAKVHFNTTESWERSKFRALNTFGTKLSPSILIRNMEKEYPIVEMLLSLNHDSNFVLAERVCWNQRMIRKDLITGLTLLKVAGMLHSRFGKGSRSARYVEVVPALQRIYERIGRNAVRDNLREFWGVMDECWQVRNVTFKEGAVFLRTSFLFCLTSIISEYDNFWRDSKLFIERDLRKKIALFPINDPEVVRLAATGQHGAAGDLLYQLMLRHINSGKRTKRLTNSND